jgi:ABC-type Fe3+/spermidine/putrescine transport system ATPase subunit
MTNPGIALTRRDGVNADPSGNGDRMMGAAQAAPDAPVLRVRRLEKRFGGMVVLSECSIDIAEGEIVTLLGPSGCGKTTLLRCIAGFWTPDAGAITIDGQDALPVPVNRRPVGVVFQSYALFPHMTVAQNVGYGLRMRGVPKAEIARAVARALETVSLSAFADRWPAQLSGGQQQRVAVARVLVLEPRVLLLDEPFSALDAKLRGAMQMDLRQLIKRLGITAIFVTHDQEEALIMSDRIAVMRQGRIEQIAAPEVVFDHPATAYVADFVGASNFWPAEAQGGRVRLPDGTEVPTDLSGPVRAMARPHNIRLEAGTAGPWTGTVTMHRPVGPLVDYVVRTDAGTDIKVSALRQEQARILPDGAAVTLRLRDPSLCAVYPPERA